MNPLRRAVHAVMEKTGIDRHIEALAINRHRELRHSSRFPIVSSEDGNRWLYDLISAGRPAAVGKLGSSECWALAWHLGLKRFYKYTWAAPAFGELDLCEQSGVFPNTPELFHRFAGIYLERLADLDGCAVWHNTGESKILAHYAPQVRRLGLTALEPYFFTPPWTAALAGGRVLVIHPFEPSIRAQFARRAELWPGSPDVLPAFDLEVIRAPYGFSATSFSDWCEMLRWIEEETGKLHRRWPIDVAVIGCGAAGVPLASFVKRLGGIGIHTGGATQILFGVRGGRWDKRPEFQRFFNPSWVRPMPEETPAGARKVDNGGYW